MKYYYLLLILCFFLTACQTVPQTLDTAASRNCSDCPDLVITAEQISIYAVNTTHSLFEVCIQNKGDDFEGDIHYTINTTNGTIEDDESVSLLHFDELGFDFPLSCITRVIEATTELVSVEVVPVDDIVELNDSNNDVIVQ